jgi:hypothetical protein
MIGLRPAVIMVSARLDATVRLLVRFLSSLRITCIVITYIIKL